MAQRYKARDRLEYCKLNQDFHSGVLRLSGNSALQAAHLSIRARLKRIRYIGNSEPHKWKDAMAEHDRMIRNLEARDSDKLAAILVQHMEHTWERVKETL